MSWTEEGGVDLLSDILDCVRRIPAGRVTTFGDVASALGDVKASRAVGESLAGLPAGSEVPRHRVVFADGRVPNVQAFDMLAREGVAVRDGKVEGLEGMRFTDFAARQVLLELRQEQEGLRLKVSPEDALEEVRFVTGLDLAYLGNEAVAAQVTMDLEGRLVDSGSVWGEVRFPYIPGYLGYRELPLMARLLRPREGTVHLIDGHGVLHPRRFGVACHVGVALGIPTIGAAKSLLIGRVSEAGDVVVEGEVLGRRMGPPGGKGTYVSVGHMVSLDSACDLVRGLMAGAVPQPLRLAHALASRERRRRSQ